MPRARSRSSLIALDASTRALRTSSAASGWSSRRSSARPSCMLKRDEPGLRAVVQVALDPAQLGGLDVQRAAARAGQHVHALGQLLLARRMQRAPPDRRQRVQAERGDHAEQRPEEPEAEPGQRPDEGQDAAGDARQAAWVLSARHWRGPALALRIAYCTRERDRQPEPHPDRPEIIAEAGRDPDHDHHEDDQPGEAELHRVRDAPVDLAAGLVCPCSSFSMVSTIALRTPVSRWGAMASRTEAVPTPSYHRPPMPAPNRRRPAIKETPVEQRPGEALIWTDGACSGNPGPGGWAAIVIPADGGEPVEHSGGERADDEQPDGADRGARRACARCPTARTSPWSPTRS